MKKEQSDARTKTNWPVTIPFDPWMYYDSFFHYIWQ